ncbi:MAG: aspartyl protease family protein [Bryobacterales bacterium]|nr:aspartyl protease family protein [Bryobacterales bacterium]
MHQLQFTGLHSYVGAKDGISVPVELRCGAAVVRLAASLDTGATFCIFRSEVAEALGLDLRSGLHQRFRTANSSFEAFGHEVELAVLDVVTHSTVYFFAEESINKNVLGRIGWLDRVRLGLVDHDGSLYLAPYNSA